MRRVAELADGWIPMPTTGMSESAVTATVEDGLDRQRRPLLTERIAELRQMFADAGRDGAPTVAFTPPSLLMTPRKGRRLGRASSSTRPVSWRPPASRS